MSTRCRQCLSSVQTLITRPKTKEYVCPKHGRISDPRMVEEVAQQALAPGNNNLSMELDLTEEELTELAQRERRALGRVPNDPKSASWL